ncbi:MAG: DoxX family protein [Gammaproteobacteria bacterium]|nr:DoxX family protein [Gammaproteobacteria bacterium]MDE2345908.1 DoxX family protein [Gammaproteobacteria bacterium]
MKQLLRNACHYYQKSAHGLEWLSPLSLLLFRLWVAVDFFRAGLVKISDMQSTIALFQNLYHVPLLPPVAAAYTGTAVELILPWFLGFGLAGRLTALVLFFYNIIAVISFPDLWPHGLWHGFWHSDFTDHKVWGLMLLAMVFFGPGKLSVDHLVQKWVLPKFGCRPGLSKPRVNPANIH